MNKKEVLDNILSKVVRSSFTDSNCKISGITTNLQVSQKTDLVFYNIRDDQSAKKLFLERLDQSTYGIIVTNQIDEELENHIIIDQSDFLEVQKILADIIYPRIKEVLIIGVTGTNGKTTVVNFASQITKLCGKKCISVGTLGIRNENNYELNYLKNSTMPSYVELRKIIYEQQEKIDVIFLEVSSHGLHQNRLYDLKLDVAGWLNITQDHLDYHKNMDNYFESKLLIFNYLKEDGICLIPEENKNLYENILKRRPELTDKLKQVNFKNIKIETPGFIKTIFNKMNFSVAYFLNGYLWKEKVEKVSFDNLLPPDGRYNVFKKDDRVIIVDYAHTPDAIRNIILGIRGDYKGRKVAIVFGCGGDRDKSKRSLMGNIAEKKCDKIILTNDNPRSESPHDIVKDILDGIKNKEDVLIELDRKKAIQLAFDKFNDYIIVIAGKGHEDYQEISGKRISFSDIIEVKKIIKRDL